VGVGESEEEDHADWVGDLGEQFVQELLEELCCALEERDRHCVILEDLREERVLRGDIVNQSLLQPAHENLERVGITSEDWWRR
jgi:hypothetical protein